MRAHTGVMLYLTLCGQITTKAHRDRAGSNLSQAGSHDYSGGTNCREAGSECERDGKTIRHPENRIADDLTRRKVPLAML